MATKYAAEIAETLADIKDGGGPVRVHGEGGRARLRRGYGDVERRR
jgi:hypothetical protein